MGSCDCADKRKKEETERRSGFYPVLTWGVLLEGVLSIDALGLILIMNVLYRLESVADSSIQWGAVGECFSLENRSNKIIKF